MNWAAILPVILAEVSRTSGLPTYWRNQPAPCLDPIVQARVQLHVLSSGSIGVDETRWVDGVQTRYGVRRITVRALCESYRQAHPHAARQYLERMRTRLWLETSVSALDAVAVALVRFGDLIDLDAPKESRMTSISAIDLHFGYATTETADTTTGVIEGVGLGSTLAGDIVVPSDFEVPV